MAISMDEYTKFFMNENQIGTRELMTLQSDKLTTDLFNMFQKQKFDKTIELYYANEEHYLRNCPHLAVLVYFTAMAQVGKTYESFSNIRRIKSLPYLPANMFATVDKYLEIADGSVIPPDKDQFEPETLLEKIKKDYNQIMPCLIFVQVAIKNGADVNSYNNIFRFVLSEPQMPANYKYQTLEFMNELNSKATIYGDFELAYRDEPVRTITIDDDVIAKYDPLIIAFDTFVSKIEDLKDIVKSSMMNFLTVYHYLNYGKAFPFRSSEQMEIFIFYALSQISKSLGIDTTNLHTELIPGFNTAYDIQKEVDKFLYYISTDCIY